MPITTERDRVLCDEREQNAKKLGQGRYQWNVLDGHPLIPAEVAAFGVSHENLSARMYPAKAVASCTGLFIFGC